MALPDCGLYRTGIALPDREERVPAGRLIYFHNHSEQGPPLVLLPRENVHNRWSFQPRGYLVKGARADAFTAALIKLPRQGFYAVKVALEVGADQTLAPRTLVQVGYNPKGEAILFPAEFHGNGMWFPERGFRFDGLHVFEHLSECGFDPPKPEAEPELLLH